MANRRRAEISVEFDTQGIEQRIAPDLESAVFRSVDEAIAGFILLTPPSVLVRLIWAERELVATVEGTWPRGAPDDSENESVAPATRPGATPPVLLAMMEEMRSQDRDAVTASRSLSPERVAEIASRASAFGMTLTMHNEGQVMELIVPIRYENA